MPNNNLSKSKQKEIKDLIEKGRNQGFLTLSEINDLLPTSSYDSDQIDGIIKLITDLKIKVVESNKDIETEVVLSDDELSDDDDNEIRVQCRKVFDHKSSRLVTFVSWIRVLCSNHLSFSCSLFSVCTTCPKDPISTHLSSLKDLRSDVPAQVQSKNRLESFQTPRWRTRRRIDDTHC